jgi:hypothetical protein
VKSLLLSKPFLRPGPSQRPPMLSHLSLRQTASAVLAICIASWPAAGEVFAQSAQASTDVSAGTAAPASVPRMIRYSGTLVDSRGYSITTPVSVTFAIYAEQSGEGNALWQETQQISPNSKGGYTVLLGSASATGIPTEIFQAGETQWLAVKAEGEAEQARVLLVSVPYALKAGDAQTLGGLPATAFALAGAKTSAVDASGAQTIEPDSNANVTTPGGTTGYLPVFTGGTTVADSILFSTSTGIGVGDVPNSTAVFDVNGKSIWRGLLNVSRAGTATASTGYDSYPFLFQASSYNSSTKAATLPEFEMQAEPAGNNTAAPGGTFNLLYNANSGTLAETGLSFNGNGTINFAAGQTFPGTGTGDGTITGVTAGTGLTGGGTTGVVTLNVDTTKVPLLKSANTFTGNQTITGNLTTSGTFQAGTVIATGNMIGDTNVVSIGGMNADSEGSNAGTISPGLTFGAASGEGISSDRTSSSGNQYGLDFYTDFLARMSITQGGAVGIGTLSPFSQLEVDATASTVSDAFSGSGYYYPDSAFGSNGTDGYGGDTDGTSEATGGNGGYFIGGGADTAADAGYGIYAEGGFGAKTGVQYSADFQNDILVDGNSVSDVSSTKIDHPSDPANKYLNHASVQSSEMMNIYSGNVTTDELGLATVPLPSWFEAENGDFRYQLTIIGRDAHAWVAQKVQEGKFQIATNATNVEVSWQITAVRQDAYAKAHPLVVEEMKPAREVGFYQHPELFGQPKEKQTEWGRNPKGMQRMEAQRAAIKARQANGGKPAGIQPKTEALASQPGGARVQ